MNQMPRSPINDELEFHIEMQTRRYVEAGLDPVAARAKAMDRIGDIEAAIRASHAITPDNFSRETTMKQPWLPTLLQDARYAVRVLARTPFFTATALLTLAVGIGATTAIFSVVNAVLLRTLPYPNADRILVFYNSYPTTELVQAATAPPEFADVKSQAQAFEQFAAVRPQISALTDDCPSGECEPERVNAYVVSPELFDVLGVRPQQGRPFALSDGITGANRVVMLTDAIWRRRYNSDPVIVGRTISLGGIARTVIGVMPPEIRFPDESVGYLKDRADLWIPVSWENTKDERGNQFLVTLALRRPGVTMSQARADLQRIGEGFKTQFPDRYGAPNVWLLGSQSLIEQMIGDVRLGLIVLFGAVACVLLIACANVANLMLARGASRQRELAVRSALGANRRRLIQQLLVETLVLTTAGAVLGVAVAQGGLQLLLTLNPGNIPRLDSARIDASVLMFAAVMAVLTGVVVGLIPALRQANADPQTSLGDATRGTDTTSPRRRLRGLLVMAEVAMAVIVLTGAALLVRSFIAMASVPTGVKADGVAVARLSIPRATYNERSKVFAFHKSMRDRLAATPGVTHASAVYPLPMSNNGWSGSVSIVGRPPVSEGVPEPHAEYAVALPGYFETVGIPLLEGRDFTEADSLGAPLAAVVDAEFARTYWPGQSAVGQRIATSGDLEKGPFQTVVGVVGHVRNDGARKAGEGQLYLAALQKQEFSLFFLAKTGGNPSALLPSIRLAVREQDARLPIATLSTMDEVVAKFTARERFNMLLFVIFGGVALSIASVGLYGVLAFLVTQRTREIGIRLALGGKPADLVRSVVFEGMALTVVGLVAGLGGAAVLSRWMKDLLFEIKPTDPLTYAVIAIVMLTVAILASLGPARRATRVDPVEVLR